MGKSALKPILAISALLALSTGGTGSAQEEKSDCDDCVIVRLEAARPPEAWRKETGVAPGASSKGLLASTLWGLFMVSRPRRMPPTSLRGMTAS